MKKGFTLLMTLLYITATLSIGLGVALLVMGELGLSGTGRESQLAFYGADFGAECALYWDLKGHKFPYKSGGAPADFTITSGCSGRDILVHNLALNIYTFSAYMENNSCANVTVTKFSGGGATIAALGYNGGNADANQCPAPGGRHFERGLQITY